jgi:hypothetical protein
MFLVVIFLSLLLSCAAEARAEGSRVLEATVEETAIARTRIKKFDDNLDPSAAHSDSDIPKTRIHRASATDSKSTRKEELLPEFASVDPALFTATRANPYDLEAESNSKELMIAWELWHKQLSMALYRRVKVMESGGCVYKVTVTRDHHLSIIILKSVGSPLLREDLVNAAKSLDGNPGLSFPVGSKRQVTSDSLVLICGRNIRPGVDWNHGDVERIRLDW